MLTNGGNPVYLPPNGVPASFRFIGHGTIAGVPTPLVVAFLVIVTAAIILSRSRFGRVLLASGIQPSVVRYSGLSIRAHIAIVYIPSSGNAFLLNAIGATFIGTTFSPRGRPNIPGTVLGVLLLAIVANGLLLSDLNFYWQQVGTGTLIFAVLAVSFGSREAHA